MNTPILSIAVPTKNKYQYLRYFVELIASFSTNELELVIADNSSDNSEFQKKIDDWNYPWIKYDYCPDNLTSIQNFDRVLEMCSGEFVCFMGDDDGVCRNVIDCAKWMKKNNVEVVRPLMAQYVWPDSIRYKNGLVIVERTFKRIEYLNPIIELQRILKNGVNNLGKIPVAYTGIVKKEVLEKIHADCGTYFPGGASGDVANGTALCFYAKRYVKINVPITITGTCSKSGGGYQKKKGTPFSAVSFISQKVGVNWEGDLPKFWGGDFVWAESCIKSLRAIGKEEMITHMNYQRISARLAIKHSYGLARKYWYYSMIRLPFYIMEYYIHYFGGKVLDRLQVYLNTKWIRKKGCLDIIEAERELSKLNFDFNKLAYE